MKRIIFFLGCLLFFLNSCSKDDNPTSPEEPQGTLQGVFIDSPVSGLRYETETHSGFTDENGKFDYEEGETVTFYVGDIKLGSAPVADEISPISIASSADADINTLEVQNIAAFLQTLDEDGDPTNGIKITSEVTNAISISEIDFTNSIIQILGEIALEVFQTNGVNLKAVYPEIATVHLAQTLGLEFEPEASFTLNFLPTFTNYFEDSNAINWIHEFDDTGNLIKSTKYEKYPSRILSEYTFSEYDYENMEVKLDINNYRYSYYPFNFGNLCKVSFDENFNFVEFLIINELEDWQKKYEFDEVNEEGWIKSVDYSFIKSGRVTKEERKIYEYNDLGFKTEVNEYNSQNILNYTSKISPKEFGDIHTVITEETEGTVKSEYFYREDNTLERLNLRGDTDTNDYQIVMEYDELEILLKRKTISGENNESISYFEEGLLNRSENYMNGFIQEELYWYFDGGRFILVKEKIFDSNGNLQYTDYYDNDGNFLNREYPS